jgi:hypothetical protein
MTSLTSLVPEIGLRCASRDILLIHVETHEFVPSKARTCPTGPEAKEALHGTQPNGWLSGCLSPPLLLGRSPLCFALGV